MLRGAAPEVGRRTIPPVGGDAHRENKRIEWRTRPVIIAVPDAATAEVLEIVPGGTLRIRVAVTSATEMITAAVIAVKASLLLALSPGATSAATLKAGGTSAGLTGAMTVAAPIFPAVTVIPTCDGGTMGTVAIHTPNSAATTEKR